MKLSFDIIHVLANDYELTHISGSFLRCMCLFQRKQLFIMIAGSKPQLAGSKQHVVSYYGQ